MDNKWFTKKQLAENIWGFGEFKHFEKVISYLIIGDRRALLFDTGLGIYNIKKEVNFLTNLPIIIVNSHSHYDHVGGNKFFKGVDIFSHGKSLPNNKIIKLSPFFLKVICTPGHSPNGICLYEQKKGFLFTGDTVYPGPIYLHLKESNISEYKKSIAKLILLKKVRKIFPGHNQFKCDLKINIKISLKLKSINKTDKKIIIDKQTSLLLK